MGSTRGKLITLGALVLLWGVVLLGRGWMFPSEPTSAPVERKPGVQRVAAASSQVPHLKKELIDLPRPPYPPEAQNIFGAPPPPPALPAAGGPGGAAAAAAAPPPPPPDPFQEGAKQLKYLGFLRNGASATAFISQGQDLYTAATGEVVAGRYRVVQVVDEAVVLASPAGDKQVRVLLAPDAATSAGRPQAATGAARPPAPVPGR